MEMTLEEPIRTIEEMQAELRDLEARRLALRERSDAIRSAIAERCAEFKVGQRVVHYGRVFEITAVTFGWSDGTSPKYMGRQVKKDGSLGSAERDLYGQLSLYGQRSLAEGGATAATAAKGTTT